MHTNNWILSVAQQNLPFWLVFWRSAAFVHLGSFQFRLQCVQQSSITGVWIFVKCLIMISQFVYSAGKEITIAKMVRHDCMSNLQS